MKKIKTKQPLSFVTKTILKIVFSFLFVAFTCNATLAQVEKGSKLLGGTFLYTNGYNASSSSFIMVPQFGYFITDDFMIGGGLGIEYFQSASNAGTTGVVISPFVRKYFEISESKFYFFINGGIGGTIYDDRGNVLSIGISPGFAYFFSPKWGLDLLFTGVNFETTQNRGSRFQFGASSFSPRLGFNFYF